jgi:hypothetical protein
MEAITRAVYELASQGVRVLSPADPRVVAAQGEFLFVASDPVRSVRLVQDRHLDCIRASSFVWLVCPDGYVGQSASMEIGFAAGAHVPIFASSMPLDLTLREYVKVVKSVEDAVCIAGARDRRPEGFLVDANANIEGAQAILQNMTGLLRGQGAGGDPVPELYKNAAKLKKLIALPTSVH